MLPRLSLTPDEAAESHWVFAHSNLSGYPRTAINRSPGRQSCRHRDRRAVAVASLIADPRATTGNARSVRTRGGLAMLSQCAESLLPSVLFMLGQSAHWLGFMATINCQPQLRRSASAWPQAVLHGRSTARPRRTQPKRASLIRWGVTARLLPARLPRAMRELQLNDSVATIVNKKMPGAVAGQKVRKQCGHYNRGLPVAIG
jgi:hypothetical protein